ncbi:MAG: S1/P1 nuclease [Natronospirillum sp.]|uniref:S1/P1 nuclease n=1 Tax=Natronospirillum sp. TaxID=2812955 RepID=UPI0025E1D045|nr:S1/P1 nuclease [Natronospirillum sp.]MCH8551594.1 S1/P1 nuclease [Natronospirillum sp.]
MGGQSAVFNRRTFSWHYHCAGFSGGRLSGRAAQCLITLGLALCLALPAQAFGERGHQIVAQLSTYYLSDDAQALVRDLYGEHYRRLLLEDANYAQQVTRRRGNEWRLGFHYTFFEEGDTGFQPERHCPNGICSVAAVLDAEAVLADESASRARRLDAFRFLVHYMADLHDPVNAGFSHDRGGRETELVGSDLERRSLFEIWQNDLFDHLSHPPFVMANIFARQITDEQRREWQQGEPASWVWETHEVARDLAYPLADRAGGWNSVYRREALPALETQLKKAGVRLATRLNQVAAAGLIQDPLPGNTDVMEFEAP